MKIFCAALCAILLCSMFTTSKSSLIPRQNDEYLDGNLYNEAAVEPRNIQDDLYLSPLKRGLQFDAGTYGLSNMGNVHRYNRLSSALRGPRGPGK